MIEIKIPKEIRHYKEKLAFGLTVRQLISVTLALSINIPLYILGRDILGDELMSWLVIIIAVPLAMIGWFNYNGLNFEQFLVALIQFEFLYPKKRIYKSENIYENILDISLKEGDERND